jgi:malonate-semialdehyde dehydrogenase (acetylating)/methylmalonate-semialdehyde dehydrogenase
VTVAPSPSIEENEARKDNAVPSPPPSLRATTLEAPPVDHFVAGRRAPSLGSRSIAVASPIDGAALGVLRPAGAELVSDAVAAAASAFASWSRTPVKERVQPLFRFKQLVEQRMDEIAALVTSENGKTLEESEAGIRRGLEVVEFATSLPGLLAGDLLEVSAGVDGYTRRLPLGVTAGITPFNFPAMVPMWMFPLAIACGNTFILKPSEQVPITPVRLGEILAEAGLPPGVLNVIQGDRETVEAILDDRRIVAAAFVGSTPVAKAVYERGIAAGKRMLTLGGAKNHLVVVPDADVEITARNVASSATGCAGQRCMAASVLIAVGDCDAILDAIEAEMRRTRPGVEMGAVISREAKDRITGYVDQAARDGAVLRLDGRRVTVPGKENGHYVGPTLIDRLSAESPCVKDEIFGPVLSILRVATLEEAIAIENASPYGNAASIYTTSGAVARRFEERANAGMIGINIGVPVPRDPISFGGWNDSKLGVGDITGRDAIGFWTKSRKVTAKWTARSRDWMS